MSPTVLSFSNGNIDAIDYNGFIWSAIISTVCCIGLGIFWVGIVQLAPIYMPVIAAVAAFVAIVVIAVFSFLVHNQ